jgi:hypothetical protein
VRSARLPGTAPVSVAPASRAWDKSAAPNQTPVRSAPVRSSSARLPGQRGAVQVGPAHAVQTWQAAEHLDGSANGVSPLRPEPRVRLAQPGGRGGVGSVLLSRTNADSTEVAGLPALEPGAGRCAPPASAASTRLRYGARRNPYALTSLRVPRGHGGRTMTGSLGGSEHRGRDGARRVRPERSRRRTAGPVFSGDCGMRRRRPR